MIYKRYLIITLTLSSILFKIANNLCLTLPVADREVLKLDEKRTFSSLKRGPYYSVGWHFHVKKPGKASGPLP